LLRCDVSYVLEGMGYDGEVGAGHTLMFLLREHENRKHQLRRQHRLYEHALRQTRALTQRGPHIERRRKQHADEVTRENAAADLRSEQHARAHRRNGADEHHSECNSGIEQAAGYAEEDPHVDHETETEDEGNVQELVRREARGLPGGGVISSGRPDVSDLSARKREEEKHRRAHKLSYKGDKVVLEV
jgi:hypothetical protein